MATTSMLLLLLIQFLLLVAEGGAKVPAIIVFGDSSVDAGNNNQIPTMLRSNFEPYGRDFNGGRPTGRFSNGRIPTDFISEAFGLRPAVPAYLDPAYSISDFAIGVTFASAGTGYDNATSDVMVSGCSLLSCHILSKVNHSCHYVIKGGLLDTYSVADVLDFDSVIPLWKELEYYKEYQKKLRAHLGDKKADDTLREALYIMSIGTNDFLENYYTLPNRRSQFTVDQYQAFLVGIARNFVVNLYALGARKITLGGLPPMGCLPLERTTNFMGGNQCVETYNVVAVAFNNKLTGLVAELNKELPGIRMVFSNPYPILMQIVRKPSAYGNFCII
ncbi:hypothetical protein U1Q18_024451 [Sarracenia purpurea var. burkii]